MGDKSIDKNIIQLGLAAEIAFCRAMATDCFERDGILAITIGLHDPILNLVVDAQLSEEELDENIQQVIAFFKQHNVIWNWVVGPLSKPATLTKHLEQHGLVWQERFPGMHFDFLQNIPDSSIEYFKIIEVPAIEDLSVWSEALAEGFPTADNATGYLQVNANLPYGTGAALRHYVGYYKKQVVSSVTLFISDEAVMIHNLATKTAFLKRGFGTAMTLHAMREAKKLRRQHCFLDASASGASLYKRIGFQPYCYYDVYGLLD